MIREAAADMKATRAEAALMQLLVSDEQDMDVTLTTTFISSIDTFHSNLASPDEIMTDEDLQQKLMVCSNFLFIFYLFRTANLLCCRYAHHLDDGAFSTDCLHRLWSID